MPESSEHSPKLKSVLVTGASGLIGTDLLDSIKSTHEVRTYGRKLIAGFKGIKGELSDRTAIDTAMNNINTVVHLAAMAGVRASVDQPALYFDVNVSGTLNLLEGTQKNGKPNFVFASTSSAYGRTERVPFTETDVADRPLAPYPASKRSVELLGHAYHHMHGVDFTAVRFFTVYGLSLIHI